MCLQGEDAREAARSGAQAGATGLFVQELDAEDCRGAPAEAVRARPPAAERTKKSSGFDRESEASRTAQE